MACEISDMREKVVVENQMGTIKMYLIHAHTHTRKCARLLDFYLLYFSTFQSNCANPVFGFCWAGEWSLTRMRKSNFNCWKWFSHAGGRQHLNRHTMHDNNNDVIMTNNRKRMRSVGAYTLPHFIFFKIYIFAHAHTHHIKNNKLYPVK